MSFGSDTAFYIDDFTCGHSWYSIEDFNNKMYFHLNQQGYNINNNWSFIITIENGNYTGADFALELQSKIRAFTNVIIYNLFNVVYYPKINNIKITVADNEFTFKILTPDDLKTGLNNTFLQNYNKSQTNDCNEVLSNLNGLSDAYTYTNPYISGFLNLQPINNIYLHSSSLGNYNSLSCDGSQTVIKKNTSFTGLRDRHTRSNGHL